MVIKRISFNIFLIILFIFILKIFFDYLSLRVENNEKVERELVEKVLKNNYNFLIHYKKNQVTLVYKEKEKLKTQKIYVPIEGKFEIVSSTSNVDKELFTQSVKISSTTYVLVKYAGFTFKPVLSFHFSENEILIGSRLVYYKKFGSGFSLNKNLGIIFFDYKLDSLKYINNTSIGISYKIYTNDYKFNNKWGIILNINF